MSAQLIYDLAPIGSVVRCSDGTPRPPLHFGKRLAAWKNNNGGGRLIRKIRARRIGNDMLAAGILLHHGNLDIGGASVMAMRQTFSVASPLLFEVVEPPSAGSIRIVDGIGRDAELLHLAVDRASAEVWLANHPHRGAVLDEVTAVRWQPIWSWKGSVDPFAGAGLLPLSRNESAVSAPLAGREPTQRPSPISAVKRRSVT